MFFLLLDARNHGGSSGEDSLRLVILKTLLDSNCAAVGAIVKYLVSECTHAFTCVGGWVLDLHPALYSSCSITIMKNSSQLHNCSVCLCVCVCMCVCNYSCTYEHIYMKVCVSCTVLYFNACTCTCVIECICSVFICLCLQL